MIYASGMRTADPALHERRRLQILDAARVCFLERGFHQSSMADIARASGCSMGLLYRYFPAKEQIVLSFAERDTAQAHAAIAEFAASSEPRETLQVLLDSWVAQALDPEYGRLACEVMAEAGRNPQLLIRLQADDAQLRSAIAEALDAQRRSGRLNFAGTADSMTDLLMALFDGLSGRGMLQTQLDRRSLVALLMQLFPVARSSAP